MKTGVSTSALTQRKFRNTQKWNEILHIAARDLAEFTKRGIYASFIVDLANKCEEYEASFQDGDNPYISMKLEVEIEKGMRKILEIGQDFWNKKMMESNLIA